MVSSQVEHEELPWLLHEEEEEEELKWGPVLYGGHLLESVQRPQQLHCCCWYRPT